MLRVTEAAENNYAVPGPVARRDWTRLAKRLRRPAGHLDLLELASHPERDEAAVRRPEERPCVWSADRGDLRPLSARPRNDSVKPPLPFVDFRHHRRVVHHDEAAPPRLLQTRRNSPHSPPDPVSGKHNREADRGGA